MLFECNHIMKFNKTKKKGKYHMADPTKHREVFMQFSASHMLFCSHQFNKKNNGITFPASPPPRGLMLIFL